MTDLTFAVLDVAPEPYAVDADPDWRGSASTAVGEEPVHAIALRCQVRIEPQRRQYSDDEAAGLLRPVRRRGNAGPRLNDRSCGCTPPRWCRDSPAPPRSTCPSTCTYDFEVAAAKYLHALRDGTIPLQFLFSGTVFGRGSSGFAVQQVPWDCEERFDMPVSRLA